MIQLRLRDHQTVDEKLQQIEPKLARNILRTAVRAGGNIVRNAARDRIKSRSGLLRREVRTVVRRGKPGETVASVGVFARGKKGDAFYALFVEKGHRIVPRGGRIRSLQIRRRMAKQAGGRVKPHPFLLPALAAKQAEVHRVVMEHIARRLGELV